MKNFQAILISIVLFTFSQFASAALDFSGVTSAVDATTIVSAIAAIAAIKILPGVARWGFNKVITWFS